ncbi:hypothetical protein JCM33374_g6045 [Metschnikowia sp. JCM 33374]|nr:hypothetical protein JCM33374_g6045 [Metschnikowia sp. JCM 33374]
MVYDPQGPVAKELVPLLVNELTSTFNIPDDAKDTADYINMLIGQNRSAGEICADVKEVVNIPIDEAFMQRVFDEITRLDSVQNQAQTAPQPSQPPQPQQSDFQPQQADFQPPQAPQQAVPEHQYPQAPQAPQAAQAPAFPQMPMNPFQNSSMPSNPFPAAPGSATNPFAMPPAPPTFPTGPQGQIKKDAHVNFSKSATDFKRNGGVGKAGPMGKTGGIGKAGGISKGGRVPGKTTGVSKDYVSANGKPQKKSFGLQNAANLQKALSLASPDSVNMQPFTPRPPKGRCPDFPYCKNKECTLAHPTKKCFAYPNCPNPPGTCDYLHPSEDGALMQELEKTKQQFLDRKNQKFAAPQVTLCKYGILCSKELCPFGHPTPANKDAKVIIQKWCRENKNCQNPACEYAHSSPNYQAPAPAAPPKPVVPKYASQPAYNKYTAQRTPTSLEQCKFGLYCTNQSCTKRHATSAVPCRAGYNCTRMDCTFHHPIDEDCRFGNECKNSPCFFKHPDSREKALFGNHHPQSATHMTMERPFAVAEDQVMEQATQI